MVKGKEGYVVCMYRRPRFGPTISCSKYDCKVEFYQCPIIIKSDPPPKKREEDGSALNEDKHKNSPEQISTDYQHYH